MKKGYWKTREGKILKIKDMDDKHIYNTICFLTGHIVHDPVYNENFTNREMVERIRYLTKKMHEFRKEFERRQK